MKENTIVSLADEKYFNLLEELIESIKVSPKAIIQQFVFLMQD